MRYPLRKFIWIKITICNVHAIYISYQGNNSCNVFILIENLVTRLRLNGHYNVILRSYFSKVFCHVFDILKGHAFISSHYIACKYTPFRFIKLVFYTTYQSWKTNVPSRKSCNVAIISVKDKRKLYCARKRKNLAFCMNLFFMFIFMNHSSIFQVTTHERQLVQLKCFQFSTII